MIEHPGRVSAKSFAVLVRAVVRVIVSATKVGEVGRGNQRKTLILRSEQSSFMCYSYTMERFLSVDRSVGGLVYRRAGLVSHKVKKGQELWHRIPDLRSGREFVPPL